MRDVVPFVLAAILLGGCAGGPAAPDDVGPDVTLTVWNRSQFPIEALYVHDDAEYVGVENILVEPLMPGSEDSGYDGDQIDVVVNNTQRVTVVRDKNEGEQLALTMAEDLEIADDGYILWVLDELFRLQEP